MTKLFCKTCGSKISDECDMILATESDYKAYLVVIANRFISFHLGYCSEECLDKELLK